MEHLRKWELGIHKLGACRQGWKYRRVLHILEVWLRRSLVVRRRQLEQGHMGLDRIHHILHSMASRSAGAYGIWGNQRRTPLLQLRIRKPESIEPEPTEM